MRYSSIDILRTLAIVVMVFVHFAENLTGKLLVIAGFGAPLFAFLSGVSYILWSNGQRTQGRSEEEISKVSVRRGLFVFGVGFAFNILVWLPEDTFNWDVLTFIGFATLLLNFLRRIPSSFAVFLAVLILFVSPLLQTLAEYNSYWVNLYFDYDLTLADVLIGFMATGYFPVFPWLAFSIAGMVTAQYLFAPARESSVAPSPWRLVSAGCGFIAASASLLILRPYMHPVLATKFFGRWTMYPPTIVYVLGTLGMSLLLFGLLMRYVDQNEKSARFVNFLRMTKTFSRYSFTLYIVHHLVHIWPLWIYGRATTDNATFYWRKAMPLTVSMPLAVVFLVACYFVLRRLGPDRNYGVESWMRWVCDA